MLKKNTFFKICAFFIICSLLLNISVLSLASEDYGYKNTDKLTELSVSGETRSTNKPGVAWNWNNGRYNFSGTANISILYTNYYFTNATTLKIYVYNAHDTDSLKVKLLKKQTGIDWSVSTKTINANSSLTWTVTVSPSNIYYLSFLPPSDFVGYIERVS